MIPGPLGYEMNNPPPLSWEPFGYKDENENMRVIPANGNLGTQEKIMGLGGVGGELIYNKSKEVSKKKCITNEGNGKVSDLLIRRITALNRL